MTCKNNDIRISLCFTFCLVLHTSLLDAGQFLYAKSGTVLLVLASCVLPGGPGRPGGPGKNMGDVRIFSLVICSGTSALFDSMAILN